jgi:hypothetical protein
MALQMNDVRAKHRLNVHVLAYFENEGVNFSTMTFALTFVVSCEVMGLFVPFIGTC